MQLIDINPTDNQKFSLNLNGETYNFRLIDRGTAGVFMDIASYNQSLITGVLCLDRVKIIRSAYKRFPGDLMFVDQNGSLNPTYLGFGSRFLLYHIYDDGEVGL